jgi:hypothetical protein
MKKTSVAAIVGGSALSGLLGMGLGYLSADGVPDTETKTVEVVKEVPVPGPTTTVTEEVEVEKRVEYIDPKVKMACTYAMDRAEQVGEHAAEFADIAAGYLPLIEEAYMRGVSVQGVEPIISEMERLSAMNEDLNRRTDKTIGQYNRAASACEVGME